MPSIPNRTQKQVNRIRKLQRRIAAGEFIALTPDFPFDYKKYLERNGSSPLGTILPENIGKSVAIVGGGVSGLIAAYEVMRMGLRPIIFEASDRLGGRFYSYRFDGADPATHPIAEMGAMRFPTAGKALEYYYRKTGMWENKVAFPNPGTDASPSNIVDYKGKIDYYESTSPEDNPYLYLEDKFFGDDISPGLVNSHGMKLDEAIAWQTEIEPGAGISTENQTNLKNHWNTLIKGTMEDGGDGISYDIKTFRDLLTDDGWSFADIEAFGQVGFGTGGWNTDYVNGSLELLRVMYMELDVDHQLMLDGADALPASLYTKPPSFFGDEAVNPDVSLQDIQMSASNNPLNSTVVGIKLDSVRKEYIVTIRDTNDPAATPSYKFFDAVIYTPHVRILDKMRYQTNDRESYTATTALLRPDTWEAIMYTHYMQSTKVFQVTSSPFWKNTNPEDGRFLMSTTLSDRLTRGTYLVDYSANQAEGGNKGYGCFQSYTWNDDSVKFVSADNKYNITSWANMTKACLNDIYSRDDVFFGTAEGQSSVTQKWEDNPFFLCAFKNNLAGQYRYQQRLFEQFHDNEAFILAGDDISWVAGWAEGAVTTALNAVSKIEYLFNGNEPNPASPHGQFDQWKPVDIN